MTNELQMISTNQTIGSRIPTGQWHPYDNRRDEMMSMKKAALELDAALPTRRALGTWAAVEIMADVDATPGHGGGGLLSGGTASQRGELRRKPATLPRPNTSFLHGFHNPYQHKTQDTAASKTAKEPPTASRSSESKSESVQRLANNVSNDPGWKEKDISQNSVASEKDDRVFGEPSRIESTKESTVASKSTPAVVPKAGADRDAVAVDREGATDDVCKVGAASSSLRSSSKEKKEEQAKRPGTDVFPESRVSSKSDVPQTTSVLEVPRQQGSGNGDVAVEDPPAPPGTGCPRLPPAPIPNALTPPPSFLTPAATNSPKKPSFRVVRRRDSRRKEVRRHHAMAVLPSSKVATLASKFNALILEKECSPSQPSKPGARLYRTLPSQKSAGAVVLRRRGFAYLQGEGDIKRSGRKSKEEPGCRKSEGELPKRSPSSVSVNSVSVALKAPKTSVTSVKDAIKLFEDNLRTRPPVPRKPQMVVESFARNSPSPEAKAQKASSAELPRLLVATKIEVFHPETVSSVIEALKSKEEVIEIVGPESGVDDDDAVDSNKSYVNVDEGVVQVEVRAVEQSHISSKEVDEDSDGGYEPVSPVPLPVPNTLPLNKPAPPVKPNSSFLWGTQPCTASSTLSASLKKISLADASPTTDCPPQPLLPPPPPSHPVTNGYDSLEDDEEDGYDDIGPPTSGQKRTNAQGRGGEADSLGGYESFSVSGRDPQDGVVGTMLDGCAGDDRRKHGRMVDFYEGLGSVYGDMRTLAAEAAAAAKAETTSVSNCYESIYCGEGRILVGGSRAGGPGDRRSVSSEESRGGSGGGSDSLSNIELKSNSLYGRCGSALSDSGESRTSEVVGPHEVLSYQLTSVGLGGKEVTGVGGESERRSDTSDDWMDVDASDAEDEDNGSESKVIVFREWVPRGRRSPSWSKKVRREYSRRSRKSRDAVDMETEQHHYETLYEMVGGGTVQTYKENCTVEVLDRPLPLEPPPTRQHALPYENLSDDDFDSFDSDLSDEFDDQVPTKDLPSIPNEVKISTSQGIPVTGTNTNGIKKKMAEVAGKKMQEFKKNWSIRKHDLSRSLLKIRKKSGSEQVIPVIHCHPQPPLPPTPDAQPPPPPPPARHPAPTLPPPLPPERTTSTNSPTPPNHHAVPPPPPPPNNPNNRSPLPPAPLNKSVSSGNLTGRKYWSFKSRFGRRASASTSALQRQSSVSPSTSPSSSTFYLTETLNADTGLSETSDGSVKALPIEKTSENIRWSISGEDMINKSKNSEEDKKKPSGNRRLSMRPRGPPPPPPNNYVAQNGDIRSCLPLPSNSNLTYAPPSTASSSSSSSSPYAFNRSSPTTSWYTDMDDASLQRAGSLDEHVNKKNKENRISTASWYADIGLWPAKNSQNMQDSGRHTDTSDSSSSAVASPEGSVVHGQFTDQPLYQFYTASIAEKVTRDISQEYDSDGYEEIGKIKLEKQPSPRPKAMDLVRHKEGCRTLWCQIPEVLASGLLDTFNSHQRKIQEAKFEVVTSEASYLKSLNILVSHFVESPSLKDENLLSVSDRDVLFSNIMPVKMCSERFMAELERCWQDDILLLDICDIIRRHAEKHFSVYVNYCSNQVHLDRTLHRLKKSPQFLEVINTIESHPVCQSLSLHSFLMLPMQRVTRLPLLVDAILRRMSKEDSKYGACQVALATLNKVVQDCNEGARHAERLEEMKTLSKQLDFREVGPLSLVTGGRWLVRKGELIHLHWRDDPSSLLGVASTPAVSSVSSIAAVQGGGPASISTSKLTFGRKMVKQPLFLFLFTDLLVIAKKKSEEHYLVLDFCPRNLVEIVAGGLDSVGAPTSLQQLPQKYFSEGGKNIFLLSMLQNHEKRTVEMVLSSSQESEKERWLEAFTPASSENPDEQVYEEWDCPQVAAIHQYLAQQPDELSLELSDVVNVLRKLPDGWYLGERIRDGEKGWFPANHCTEIASAHVRAKNLRQRYRLLALSGDYLEQQRRERALAKAAKKKKFKKESKKE
ncbi:uncharacterized protein LOC124159476 isoform X2 [Ischnura elegans]|uniref:uncharacterized protein LOC124159476 isoform X2 n=1 Tax=Ischnura elegans TaxID=197161 RepID=UPI001ED88FD9|nr:uncharacterized protein LOC124159476 isoform X2 [Ischnura elegans]